MRRFLTLHCFFDTPGDPGGGGGSAPSSSAPPATASAAPASGGAPSGTGSPGGIPASSAPAFSYAEDRSQWVPPYRLQETTSRYRQLEQRYGQMEQRVRALMGVANPPNPQHQEIRSALAEIMPELAPLLQKPGAIEKVLSLVDSGRFEEVANADAAGWSRHAFQMTTTAVQQYAAAVGVGADQLDRRATERLARDLRGFIEEDPSGQRLQRYEMGDPSLVHEFVSDLVGFYVAPVRAAQTAAGAQLTAQNRRLPASGPRGGVPPQVPAKRSRSDISAAAREFVRQSHGA